MPGKGHMTKLMVLYNKPADVAAFDGYYFDKHVPLAKTIPEALFMLYQMTFAIITVALVGGSVIMRASCDRGRSRLCGICRRLGILLQ